MTTPPLAFVDCETTGVHPGRRPWEIAIIRREPNGTEATLLLQIEDIDLSNADPFGLRVGRFYERHWCYASETIWVSDGSTRLVPEHEAARAVEKATRGAHLVGVVTNFDAETFDAMLRRHQLVPAWHYHLIDVEALAVGYLHGRRITESVDQEWSNAIADAGLPWKSDELSRACGVEPPCEVHRHTAYGDALWAQRWYDAIVGHPSRPGFDPARDNRPEGATA